ncbi:hypothetical protein ICM49_14565 [Leucobacter sp. cx-169]|nr:hypothetical protein [Leucobacter sp. cx-169]
MSEDTLATERVAAALIRGIQSQGVAASAEHLPPEDPLVLGKMSAALVAGTQSKNVVDVGTRVPTSTIPE